MRRNFWKKYCLLAAVVVTIIYNAYQQNVLPGLRGISSSCPLEGPGSSAPENVIEFNALTDAAVDYVRTRAKKRRAMDTTHAPITILCTSVNHAAATNNLPSFYQSLRDLSAVAAANSSYSMTNTNLLDSLIIFCYDAMACDICKALIDHSATLCVFMDLQISGSSLAPTTGKKGLAGHKSNDYWKLTFGRVYSTRYLQGRHKVNVMVMDVDSVFFRDPLSPDSGIVSRPNDIAVVPDISPFTFKYGDKAPINGGFLYFPGADAHAAKYSKEVLDRIWLKNCHPKSNEQLVTSSVLRFMKRKYRDDPLFNPHLLPSQKFLNFCSAKCGPVYSDFASIQSASDLAALDRKMSGQADYAECETAVREKEWVFFHVACTVWPRSMSDKVAEWKGNIQSSLYRWVKPGSS